MEKSFKSEIWKFIKVLIIVILSILILTFLLRRGCNISTESEWWNFYWKILIPSI